MYGGTCLIRVQAVARNLCSLMPRAPEPLEIPVASRSSTSGKPAASSATSRLTLRYCYPTAAVPMIVSRQALTLLTCSPRRRRSAMRLCWDQQHASLNPSALPSQSPRLHPLWNARDHLSRAHTNRSMSATTTRLHRLLLRTRAVCSRQARHTRRPARRLSLPTVSDAPQHRAHLLSTKPSHSRPLLHPRRTKL